MGFSIASLFVLICNLMNWPLIPLFEPELLLLDMPPINYSRLSQERFFTRDRSVIFPGRLPDMPPFRSVHQDEIDAYTCWAMETAFFNSPHDRMWYLRATYERLHFHPYRFVDTRNFVHPSTAYGSRTEPLTFTNFEIGCIWELSMLYAHGGYKIPLLGPIEFIDYFIKATYHHGRLRYFTSTPEALPLLDQLDCVGIVFKDPHDIKWYYRKA